MTDTGKVRQNNEDVFLISSHIVFNGNMELTIDEPFIVAVADGMGGVNSGEIAARICLEYLKEVSFPLTMDTLKKHIEIIHDRIVSYEEENPLSKGLGTTLAGIFAHNESIYSFHVGDSRVYRYRNGFLRQLTVDDSLVQILFESGEISREEMFTHPQKHVLTQALGGGKPRKTMKPTVSEIKGGFLSDDIFLICSDGLCDYVSIDKIENILSLQLPIHQMANNLVKAANDAGGYDNVTILLVKKDTEKNVTPEGEEKDES